MVLQIMFKVSRNQNFIFKNSSNGHNLYAWSLFWHFKPWYQTFLMIWKKIDLDKYLIPKLCFKVLGHLLFYRSPSFQNGMHLKILGSFITFTHILHSPWCVLELCHTLGWFATCFHCIGPTLVVNPKVKPQ
jgi:hypothetical protein